MRRQGVQDHFERIQDAWKVYWRRLPFQGSIQALEPAKDSQTLGWESKDDLSLLFSYVTCRSRLVVFDSQGNAQSYENAPLWVALSRCNLSEKTSSDHVLHRHWLSASAKAQGRHLGRHRASIGLWPVCSSMINQNASCLKKKRR